MSFFFFCFFNDTATTEIYTLSLHDALPICLCARRRDGPADLEDDYARPRALHARSCPRDRLRRQLRREVLRPRRTDWRGKMEDRKSTRLNSSHANISYAVFCLKKKNTKIST